MPKYRVLETSFIGERLVEPGEVIDYEGKAAHNLELVEEKGAKRAPKAKADEPAADAGGTPEELA